MWQLEAYIYWFTSPRGYDLENPNSNLSNTTKPIFLYSLYQEVDMGAGAIFVCILFEKSELVSLRQFDGWKPLFIPIPDYWKWLVSRDNLLR